MGIICSLWANLRKSLKGIDNMRSIWYIWGYVGQSGIKWGIYNRLSKYTYITNMLY